MSEDLEGKCGTCKFKEECSRNQMNEPQKKVYKKREVLRCNNPKSPLFYRQIVLPNWTCPKYEANY
jgi:hypothetical protein